MTTPPFENRPPTDFSRPENRAAMQRAIEELRTRLGRPVPLIIGSERIIAPRSIPRENPSHPSERVALVSRAEPAHAESALDRAEAAFPAWRNTPVAERSARLRAAAELLHRHRFELAAWEVIEVGKPWVEADGDVAEAVDYLNYYAAEMLRLESHAEVRQVPGEQNLYRREPLGVGAVISPWNFPLAILTGMTCAALVAGNAALLKPAEQASATAHRLAELLLQAGLPPGVVQLLPGLGEEIGDCLVRSPRIRWIAFTGSKEVGLRIVRLASETPAGQAHVKRTIAEMGGKNAVIVDQDADLDEAVLGTAFSAFGYQGQKCSACSRVIVLQPVLGRFLERLVETVRCLPVGPAEIPSTVIGPLVDAGAREKVSSAIAQGKKEARVAYEGELPPDLEGHFVAPVIFRDVPPDSRIAQEEIFGPVLSVIAARSFSEAIGIANASAYALTGGVYSRSPAHIEQAKREFLVGNLYVNRKITGAVVGRQPFGGLKLSGVGYKAGGPDYLLQFLQARTITENTLRHGFAPIEE